MRGRGWRRPDARRDRCSASTRDILGIGSMPASCCCRWQATADKPLRRAAPVAVRDLLDSTQGRRACALVANGFVWAPQAVQGRRQPDFGPARSGACFAAAWRFSSSAPSWHPPRAPSNGVRTRTGLTLGAPTAGPAARTRTGPATGVDRSPLPRRSSGTQEPQPQSRRRRLRNHASAISSRSRPLTHRERCTSSPWASSTPTTHPRPG